MAVVFGDDGVSVLRAVSGDVFDRGIQIRDDPDRQDGRQVLGAPVVFGRLRTGQAGIGQQRS